MLKTSQQQGNNEKPPGKQWTAEFNSRCENSAPFPPYSLEHNVAVTAEAKLTGVLSRSGAVFLNVHSMEPWNDG